jgi:hypothetical protein
MGAAADDRVARDNVSLDDLVQDDGVLDACDVPDWLRRALGLSAEWGGSALVRLDLFRVAPGQLKRRDDRPGSHVQLLPLRAARTGA